MKREIVVEEIQHTLADAIAMVDGLNPEVPMDLRSAAFVEVFRALRQHGQNARPLPSPSSNGSQKPGLAAHVPSASLVTRKGSRVQKAIFAAVKLAQRGEEPTATAIGQYSKDEMASEIKKVADVVRGATPDLFERMKVDNVFVYTPTGRGLRHLAEIEESGE